MVIPRSAEITSCNDMLVIQNNFCVCSELVNFGVSDALRRLRSRLQTAMLSMQGSITFI